MNPFTIALLIFLCTYVIVAIQNIPKLFVGRPTGALLGAAAMVLFGIFPLREAYQSIDMDTVLFLLGMMILLGYVELSGFFDILIRILVHFATSTRRLMALVVFFSGILSALFMNDTICFLLAPIVLRMTRQMKINPIPFLIAVATAANIGSAMTIIGNPLNAMIGVRSGIPFIHFTACMWPVSIIGLIIDFFLIDWVYRAELRNCKITPDLSSQPLNIDWVLLVTSMVCGAAMLVLLSLGYPPAGVAMGLATVVTVAGAFKPRGVLKRIDWPLLVFFASLFIVMHGIEKAGVASLLFANLPAPPGARNLFIIVEFSLTIVLLGNLVSSVPAVLLYIPLLKGIPHAEGVWLTLAMAATLSGNLTIIGSMANVIVFESAGKKEQVSFWEYLRIGLPLTLLTILVGAVVIYFHF